MQGATCIITDDKEGGDGWMMGKWIQSSRRMFL